MMESQSFLSFREEAEDDLERMYINYFPQLYNLFQNQKRIDPTTDEYFRSEGREGGPSNPIHGFKDVLEEFKYDKYSSFKEFPVYKYLERFAQLGGFIDKLTDGVHDNEGSKNEEEPKPANKNSGGGNSKDKSKGESDKKVIENLNDNTDQEPLFVDPFCKDYLNRDSSMLPDEER